MPIKSAPFAALQASPYWKMKFGRNMRAEKEPVKNANNCMKKLLKHVLLFGDAETAPLSFFTWLAIILYVYMLCS